MRNDSDQGGARLARRKNLNAVPASCTRTAPPQQPKSGCRDGAGGTTSSFVTSDEIVSQ